MHPIIRTLAGLKQAYPDASDDTIQRYMDLRDEGYPTYEALLMSGLGDPDEA